MNPVITPAACADIAELRQLYYAVYGPHYPVALGTDPAEMARLIEDPYSLWLVGRCADTGALTASAAIHGEPGSRIGRLEGIAVHPGHRSAGLAAALTEALCAGMLDTGRLDSVYATVRTVSAGPQRVVARNGFRPLGILPNAVDLRSRESLALYARHSAGVLDRRLPVTEVPAPMLPLLRTAEAALGIGYPGVRAAAPLAAPAPQGAVERLEMIEAPAFVRRRFREQFPGAGGWFYPLHTPNVLLTPEDGRFEVYAYLNRAGGYASLLTAHPDPAAAAAYLEPVTRALARAGAGYVEALVPLAHQEALSAFLAQGFVAGALYPAMRADGDGFHDYAVLSRSSERIDFRGVAVEPPLQPYLDCYVSAWASTHLPTSSEVAS
ncbi:N-acetyltransferase [Streptomyces sp. NBC_00555]|uniref:GNAT family N-acetyltransferase n=1 Tax=unclassified Streptomyces TaxID=2593676 RepID=UPI0022570202|nr:MULTISPECIES: GNAT family N-acetyltransferase [unclassified Streptomyces]MCX5015981.1 N-acetyltransferase [Streptomyces sp. NBC_00555]MCX5609390.1 N-acetyltransferase [Streptomyces sp. NBC_00047]